MARQALTEPAPIPTLGTTIPGLGIMRIRDGCRALGEFAALILLPLGLLWVGLMALSLLAASALIRWGVVG